MPGDTRSAVSEIVSQSVKESSNQSAARSSEASGSQSDGELKLPEFFGKEVSEEEFKALPKEAQTALVKYGKSLYGGFQNKTQALAREREQIDEIKGRMEDTLKEAMNSKTTATEAKNISRSFFDELRESTPDASAREQLSKLEKGILQLTKTEDILKKMETIEKALGRFAQDTQVSHQQQVEKNLQELSQSFQPLVDKYKRDLLNMAGQYPNLSTRRLLQLVSTEDEYDQAVQSDAQRQAKKDTQRVREAAVTKPGSTVGTVSVTDKDYIKPKTPMFGRKINFKSILPSIVEEVRRGQPT